MNVKNISCVVCFLDDISSWICRIKVADLYELVTSKLFRIYMLVLPDFGRGRFINMLHFLQSAVAACVMSLTQCHITVKKHHCFVIHRLPYFY